MNKLKIGVTGGIGSGKSLFTETAKKLGYSVIAADDISKDILANDKGVKSQIINAFGNEAFIDNLPNKKFLAEKIFTNAENLLTINNILHPPTLGKIDELTDNALLTSDIVFVESALIFEIEIEEAFDYVILITADEEKRVERIINRNNLTRKEIIDRMNNQMKDEDKKNLADFTLENNGSEEEFVKKCEFIIGLVKNL